MTDLSPDYDVAFYSGQLTGLEAKEIAILARILYERFHPDPREVTREGDNGPYRIAERESTVTNVLDVGCGMGAFLTNFLALGVPKVTGVEHPHLYRTVGTSALPKGVPYDFLDLSSPLPGIYLTAWDRCDLILCLEVLEHLPPSSADQLALNLSRLPGRLVVSGAHTGQGGTWHVNERPPNYWQDKFSDFGRVLNLPDTEFVRNEFQERCVTDHREMYCRWYFDNLLIFDPVRT